MRDNGQGINQRDFKQIFERFRRLHGPDAPGSGIGLPTCKRVVEDGRTDLGGFTDRRRLDLLLSVTQELRIAGSLVFARLNLEDGADEMSAAEEGFFQGEI